MSPKLLYPKDFLNIYRTIATVWPIFKKYSTGMHSVSLKCMAVKAGNSKKNPRQQTVAILKIEKSSRFVIMQNGSLKCIGRPSWIFKVKN